MAQRVAVIGQKSRKEGQMCPACLAAMAITAAKVASVGGLAALGVKKLVEKRVVTEEKFEPAEPRASAPPTLGDSNDEQSRVPG